MYQCPELNFRTEKENKNRNRNKTSESHFPERYTAQYTHYCPVHRRGQGSELHKQQLREK